MFGGPQRRERVGDLELARAEAVDRRGPAAAPPGCAARPSARAAAAEQDALEVRRRHGVAERRGVDVAQLARRERCGASAKPTFVYESFARSRSRPPADRLVIERQLRQPVDRVPAVSSGSAGSTSRGTSPRYAVASCHSPGAPGLARASRAARDARARGRRPWPRGAGGSSPRASRPGRGSRPARTRRRGTAPARAARAAPAARPPAPGARPRASRGWAFSPGKRKLW